MRQDGNSSSDAKPFMVGVVICIPPPQTLAHFLSDFKLLILKGENVTEALEAPEVIRALLSGPLRK